MRKRKVAAVSIAREWLARGVMPVPIRAESKQPKGGKGWNEVKVTTENVEKHFTDGDNVGGLWGKPSGWIVDVDLDWPEAVSIASNVFPETFVYGRKSNPCSHYLFTAKECKTFKRVERVGEESSMIIEVRSTGTQSVLPPSIHPDGERFEIHHECSFTKITPEKLEKLVNKIACLAIFVRYYPKSGRHDYVHAVTGALVWAQWSPEETANALSWVLDAVAAREDERDQRERTVVNTLEKYGEGERVNGWPTLEQWIPEKLLAECRKWATRKKAGSITIKRKKEERDSESPPMDLKPHTAERLNPTPNLELPGLMGKLAQWIHRTSYADQPIFDVGAAFTILALATQNHFIIQGTNTPLSPFFMALGRTGGGKDSARQSIITAADQIRMAEKAFGGYQSFHALLDELGKPPHVMCWLWDEAARKMRAAAKSSGGSDSAVITWLLDLYGKGASTVLGLPGRKQTINKIIHPFMLVMAFAQPDDMISSITMTDISTGLLNRFILLDAGDTVPPSHYPDYNGFPARISDTLIEISRTRPTGDADFVPVGWSSTRTYNMMRDFREECRAFSTMETASGEVWGRAWQNALILAGLIAVGVDHKKPLITEKEVQWAMDFIKWSCNAWTIRLDATAARSLAERNSKTIERIVRDAYSFKRFCSTDIERNMLRRQWMPRTVLVRAARQMRMRELDETIQQLIQSDVISEGDYQGYVMYWWKHQGDAGLAT